MVQRNRGKEKSLKTCTDYATPYTAALPYKRQLPTGKGLS